MPFRPALARDRVMHVGQPVALVVAETTGAGAGRRRTDRGRLRGAADAVADLRAALADGAPQLLPEAPGNLALDWPGPVPDPTAPTRARSRAIFTERRACGADVLREPAPRRQHDGAARRDRALRRRDRQLHAALLLAGRAAAARPARRDDGNCPREKLRVITEDVGGAFGLKTAAYPEYPALLVAAKLTGRPVAWMATRSESFLSDQQARDTVTEAELATRREGQVPRAARDAHRRHGRLHRRARARTSRRTISRAAFPACMTIPHITVGVRCVFTNTVPTGPYRGAGRPEANYALERAR